MDKWELKQATDEGKRGCYRWEMNTLLNGKEKIIKNLVF